MTCKDIDFILYEINDVIGLDKFRTDDVLRRSILEKTGKHMDECNTCKAEFSVFRRRDD